MQGCAGPAVLKDVKATAVEAVKVDALPAASRTVTAAAPAAVPGAADPARAPAPVSAMPLAIRLVMAPADLDSMVAMTVPGSAFTPVALPVEDLSLIHI